VIPVVGTGDYLFRPVWVKDVADAVERAMTRPASARSSLDLVGPDEYTLRELLIEVRGVLGVHKPLVNVPLPLMRLATALFRLLPNPPITRDQLLMLLSGNTSDPAPAVNALGLSLTPLEEVLPQVLRRA
jgi:NADH dehydrogenase